MFSSILRFLYSAPFLFNLSVLSEKLPSSDISTEKAPLAESNISSLFL